MNWLPKFSPHTWAWLGVLTVIIAIANILVVRFLQFVARCDDRDRGLLP